jgi:hypothetical protein
MCASKPLGSDLRCWTMKRCCRRVDGSMRQPLPAISAIRSYLVQPMEAAELRALARMFVPGSHRCSSQFPAIILCPNSSRQKRRVPGGFACEPWDSQSETISEFSLRTAHSLCGSGVGRFTLQVFSAFYQCISATGRGHSRHWGDHAALAKAGSALTSRSNRCPNPKPSVQL